MKAIWSGSISFGLVNIPVKLYSAINSQSVKFRLLHKEHLKPIRYRRTCDGCELDVDWQDIVKGIEVRKGQFVVVEPEELKELKPEKTETIDIEEFVPSEQIDSIYQDKHYYVGPGGQNRAFFLLKEVLQERNASAIGRFVMREKEYVCSIESYKEGLLLTTLNYAHEIRDISQIESLSGAPAPKEGELKLARELVDKLTSEEFAIKDYKDTFAEDLKEYVEKKAKGEKIEIAGQRPSITDQDKIIEALKASLET